MKINTYIYYFTIMILISNCSDKDNFIPEVYVDFSISASEIGGVGQGIYTLDNYGVSGIIIYHFGINEYLAYDRTCSFRPSNSCEVIEFDNDESPTYLVDQCCSTKFLIEDGTPFDGPASLPLKRYNTSFDGTYIRVFN